MSFCRAIRKKLFFGPDREIVPDTHNVVMTVSCLCKPEPTFPTGNVDTAQRDDAAAAKAKKDEDDAAAAKAKKDEQDRVKRVADEKAAEEKAEQEQLEKDQKYKIFLNIQDLSLCPEHKKAFILNWLEERYQ